MEMLGKKSRRINDHFVFRGVHMEYFLFTAGERDPTYRIGRR